MESNTATKVNIDSFAVGHHDLDANVSVIDATQEAAARSSPLVNQAKSHTWFLLKDESSSSDDSSSDEDEMLREAKNSMIARDKELCRAKGPRVTKRAQAAKVSDKLPAQGFLRPAEAAGFNEETLLRRLWACNAARKRRSAKPIQVKQPDEVPADTVIAPSLVRWVWSAGVFVTKSAAKGPNIGSVPNGAALHASACTDMFVLWRKTGAPVQGTLLYCDQNGTVYAVCMLPNGRRGFKILPPNVSWVLGQINTQQFRLLVIEARPVGCTTRCRGWCSRCCGLRVQPLPRALVEDLCAHYGPKSLTHFFPTLDSPVVTAGVSFELSAIADRFTYKVRVSQAVREIQRHVALTSATHAHIEREWGSVDDYFNADLAHTASATSDPAHANITGWFAAFANPQWGCVIRDASDTFLAPAADVDYMALADAAKAPRRRNRKPKPYVAMDFYKLVAHQQAADAAANRATRAAARAQLGNLTCRWGMTCTIPRCAMIHPAGYTLANARQLRAAAAPVPATRRRQPMAVSAVSAVPVTRRQQPVTMSAVSAATATRHQQPVGFRFSTGATVTVIRRLPTGARAIVIDRLPPPTEVSATSCRPHRERLDDLITATGIVTSCDDGMACTNKRQCMMYHP
jgi:hypothetical protein